MIYYLLVIVHLNMSILKVVSFNLDHIRKKLFAIKPTKVKYSINLNSEYCVRYDVYYPNNNFPKKTRSAADFRVIVFEYEYTIYIILNNIIIL